MKVITMLSAAVISATTLIGNSLTDTQILVDYTTPLDEAVYCSVDADNLSLELIEQTDIPFDGENCAEILVELIENEGFEPIYYGTTESGFYLSGIGGIDTSQITLTEDTIEYLTENNIEYAESVSSDGELSEFDITDRSGWVFLINGELPSVGMCDYIPQPGDEIRLTFTLNYGEDIDLSE